MALQGRGLSKEFLRGSTQIEHSIHEDHIVGHMQYPVRRGSGLALPEQDPPPPPGPLFMSGLT